MCKTSYYFLHLVWPKGNALRLQVINDKMQKKCETSDLNRFFSLCLEMEQT